MNTLRFGHYKMKNYTDQTAYQKSNNHIYVQNETKTINKILALKDNINLIVLKTFCFCS